MKELNCHCKNVFSIFYGHHCMLGKSKPEIKSPFQLWNKFRQSKIFVVIKYKWIAKRATARWSKTNQHFKRSIFDTSFNITLQLFEKWAGIERSIWTSEFRLQTFFQVITVKSLLSTLHYGKKLFIFGTMLQSQYYLSNWSLGMITRMNVFLLKLEHLMVKSFLIPCYLKRSSIIGLVYW